MRVSLLVFFLLFIGRVWGLDAREILSRMQQVYAGDRLEYSCTYALYRGHASDSVYESYGGYVYRSGGCLYQKIGLTEFIYGKDFSLKVSHDEQAVGLADVQKTPVLGIDTEEALKECSDILVEDGGTYYELRLIIKNTSRLPFSLISMRIDKRTYQLGQLDLYYTLVEDFSLSNRQTDLQAPHMRITFSDLSTAPGARESLFSIATYLQKDDQTFIPAGICKGYELIDNRHN